MSAGADVQQTGLSAGAEAFVGGVVRPVSEQRLGRNKSVQRDAVHHAVTLVNELHRSEKQNTRRRFYTASIREELRGN